MPLPLERPTGGSSLDPDLSWAEIDRPDLSDFAVLRHVPLRWADTDVYGHVNNAVHYQLMDTAINGWLGEACGRDLATLSALGVVVETSCRYKREIRFADHLRVGIRLAGTGHSSVRYEVAFFIDDEAPAATARFVHVYIDPGTRRPAPIPGEVRAALARLSSDPSPP